MLSLLAKLLKALNAEGSPAQVSIGFTLGMIVGLTPLWSLSNLLLLFIVCAFRINFTAFMLSAIVFSGLAFLLDPVMEQFGMIMLTAPALQEIWGIFYANDLMRLARFNNTLVLGGLISGLVIAIPFFFLANYLIKKYRQHLLAWVAKSRIMKLLKASKFYQIYSKLSGGGLA